MTDDPGQLVKDYRTNQAASRRLRGARFGAGGYANAGIEAIARSRSNAARDPLVEPSVAIRTAIAKLPCGEDLIAALKEEDRAQEDLRSAHSWGEEGLTPAHRETLRNKKKIVDELATKMRSMVF
jgi:hypothetical protein